MSVTSSTYGVSCQPWIVSSTRHTTRLSGLWFIGSASQLMMLGRQRIAGFIYDRDKQDSNLDTSKYWIGNVTHDGNKVENQGVNNHIGGSSPSVN